MKISLGKAGMKARLSQWFPDREFFMRSKGQVKFLKISSRLQISAAAIAAGALLVWAVAMLWMGVSQYMVAMDRIALSKHEAEVQSSEQRVAAYRDSVEDVADDLNRRQQFLEELAETHFPAAVEAEKAKTETAAGKSDSEKTVQEISAIIPEAASLAQLEARQIAFVGSLTRAVDQRSQAAEDAIRKFGLNPEVLARNVERAQGGPFQPFFGKDGEKDGEQTLDPRFLELSKKLARMEALERSLIAIPSGKPTARSMITSNFGYRSDPFNGRGAMHSGIDFRGHHGAPILAAADGKISFAGRKSGYGNCIEISHGNGLVTRYAHLSKIKARIGQHVNRGTVIGGMGSTGRSTGTHLHFEVRSNGRAINPRPFLEANSDVLKIQANAEQRTGTPLS